MLIDKNTGLGSDKNMFNHHEGISNKSINVATLRKLCIFDRALHFFSRYVLSIMQIF